MDMQEQSLLDFVETPIFILEPNGQGHPVFVAFNRAGCEMMNMAAADVLGRTAREVYKGEWGEAIYQRHLSVLSSAQERSFQASIPITGGLVHLRSHLKPIIDAEGRVIRIVGTIHEVTAETELRVERERSQAVLSDLEAFTNMAAHDLRSPIRNVKALTSMLMEDFEDLGDGKLQFIEKLDEVADKALELIADILNHAEASGATESIEQFCLQQLCQDILAMLDPAGRHSAMIEQHVVHADKNAIQIVLRNLIDNAIKHNRQSTLSLSISVRLLDDGLLQFKVIDDGVGLDESLLQFFNGEQVRYGTGYGLMGIRNLIRSRGGYLSADKPAEHQGAVIRFCLPGSLVIS